MAYPAGSGHKTVEDLFAIPEEERRRVELIEGVLEERSAPTGEHGGAQAKLAAFVGPFHRRPGGARPGGWWFVTEVEVYLDPKNTFRPDVTGWRRERCPERPRGTPVRQRPDWICEILSTNRSRDTVKKLRVYQRHHVDHYWIVDPEAETLTVYRWGDAGYVTALVADRHELVHAEPFDAIPLRVGVLFGDDDEDAEP